MWAFLRTFCRDEDGTVSVEYVLIVFTMGLALIPLLDVTSGVVKKLYAPLPGLFDAIT